MDIARPEFKTQKRRRQTMIAIAVVLGVAVVSYGVSRLKPAAPTVERGTVWTDTVKRGPMLRQVRGTGSLVPSQEAVRQIPAETEATVVRILMLPGSQVKRDTILLEMSNPQTEQAAVDADLQLKAAEAEYKSLRVKLESDLMNQKAGAATVNAEKDSHERSSTIGSRNHGWPCRFTLEYSPTGSCRLPDSHYRGHPLHAIMKMTFP